MTKKELRKELREMVTAFCGGVETHSESFIDELMVTIENYSSAKVIAAQPDVIKSVCPRCKSDKIEGQTLFEHVQCAECGVVY